jgi:fatty-acyl-CoA synthase
VNHGHGRFEIKDRSKDIIISGGENVASPEVEFRMLHHPALQEAAVVAMPDDRFGEVPCAFVTLRTEFRNQQPTEAEIIEWCRGEMAGFQRPKRIIILDDLPKTNTGKVKKNELREMLKSL